MKPIFILLTLLLNLGCSLDARISSLELPGSNNVNENPSGTNPNSPAEPIPTGILLLTLAPASVPYVQHMLLIYKVMVKPSLAVTLIHTE